MVYHRRALALPGMAILDRYGDEFEFKVPEVGVARVVRAIQVATFFEGVADNERAMTQAVAFANARLRPTPRTKTPKDAPPTGGIDWLSSQSGRDVLIEALHRMQVFSEGDDGVLVYLDHPDFEVIAEIVGLPEDHRHPQQRETSSQQNDTAPKPEPPPYDVEGEPIDPRQRDLFVAEEPSPEPTDPPATEGHRVYYAESLILSDLPEGHFFLADGHLAVPYGPRGFEHHLDPKTRAIDGFMLAVRGRGRPKVWPLTTPLEDLPPVGGAPEGKAPLE
jgi:hypothetical protein